MLSSGSFASHFRRICSAIVVLNCAVSFRSSEMMDRSKFLLLAAIIIILTPAVLHGQGRGPFNLRQQPQKSKREALKKALQGTVYPIALGYATTRIFKSNTLRVTGASLAIYGAIIGPSLGNYYAEDYTRGAVGMVSRALAAWMLKDATKELMGANAADALGWDSKKVSFTDTKILIGSVLMAGSAAYNVITTGVSVSEYNEQRGLVLEMESLPDGSVAPVLTARIKL